jgi:hypothetical protein
MNLPDYKQINKLMHILLIFMMFLCSNCSRKADSNDGNVTFFIRKSELDPVFKSVLDSFILKNDNPKFDICIDLYSNYTDLYFYIKCVYPKFDSINCDQSYMFYKNRKIYISSTIDKMSNPIKKSKQNTIKCWYVLLKSDSECAIKESALFKNNNYVIEKIDTTGRSVYGVEMVEPILK